MDGRKPKRGRDRSRFNKPVRIDAIVISTQHHPEITLEQIQRNIKEYVINPVVPKELIDEETKYFINLQDVS